MGRVNWKLNTSILKEEDYKNVIKEIITNTISEYENLEVDRSSIWELVKIRVKEFSIQYCCYRNRKREYRGKLLEAKIIMLDKEIQFKNGDEILEQERKALKEQLDVLYSDKGIGAQMRSKVTWVEEGERSTSYFFGS